MIRLLLRSLTLAACAGLSLGQTELTGSISDSTTGPLLSGQVYHLTGNVTVPTGQTLTVQPGAIIKGRLHSHLLAQGTIHVDGLAGNPVIFTAITDDTVGGDSGGDGPTSGSPADWRGLYLHGSAVGSRFHHAEIRFGGASGYSCLTVLAPGTVINHVDISDAGLHGINLQNVVSPITNCSITNCNGRAVTNVPLDAIPSFSGNTASGNTGGDHEVITAYGNTDVTIGPDNVLGGVLHVTLQITSTASITFEPGLIVKSNLHIHWVLSGVFTANGTAQDPIIMTSTTDDSLGGDCIKDGPTTGSRGDWRGVYLTNSADGSSMSHFETRWGGASGYSGVQLVGATTTMDQCTLSGSTGAGLDLGSQDAGSTVTNCTFANNAVAARNVPVHALPDFSSNTSWGNDAGEYIHTSNYSGAESISITTNNLLSDTLVLSGNLSPSNGYVVDIGPGVIVKSPLHNHFVVSGILNLNGTAQDPVVLTALTDDAYGGDINLDGATTGSPGDWRGLYFNPTASGSVLNHAIIRFGGGSGYENVVLNGSNITMTNCVSEYGQGAGITFSSNTTGATVTNCEFRDCTGVAAINAPIRQLMGLSGNTATGNASNHTSISNWDASAGPVSVTLDNLIGDLIAAPGFNLSAGQTITLHEGLAVKFPLHGHGIVSGTLNLLGTKGFPIRLTSMSDDSVLGDTNLGGSAPIPGEWRGLYFQPSAIANLEHVELSYSGASGYDGIVQLSPTVTLQNVRVEYAVGSGFRFTQMGPDTKRLVSYANTEYGFDLASGNFQLNHATAYGNGVDGIFAHANFDGTVTNSISYGNTGAQFSGFAIGEVTYSNGSPTHAGQNGNISQNPGFVNANNGVLSLFESSPCVDTGDPNSDLDPDLTRADMGAHYFDHCRARTICDGKVNSAGCLPTITAMGTTDHAFPDDLVLTAGNIPGDRTGFLMWSFRTNPSIAGNPGTVGVALHGVRRCLFRPNVLTTVNSGGTPGQCDGSFSVAISHADMLTEGWLPGETVHVQFLYEDAGQPDGTPWGNSPALIFNICP